MRMCQSNFGIPVTVLIRLVTYPTSGGSTNDHLERRAETTILYIHSAA